MFITAHTVVITWNAGHLLLHAVRLSRAVFVAALLKADNKSGCLYMATTRTHTTHSPLMAKTFSLKHSSELKSRMSAES